MVAIVTGTGLGLERSSGWVLGSHGQLGDSGFGRYGEQVTVNAATGNLLINRTDEILIGLGRSDVLSRSYNSLGGGLDDNGDNWQLNAQRRVSGLTGTVNTSGSTVVRHDWDGSDEAYVYDDARGLYVCKDGAGAYDTLSFASDVWTWTDGNSRAVETYDDLNSGRIVSSADTDGNQLTYSYTGGLLTRVTTASGEYTDLTWTGNNLTQIVTTKADSSTSTRMRYSYDGSNRLATVTVDLTPDDNAITDGAAIVTTYAYDGTSTRVASISQTGGAELDIAYTLVGSDYRVASLTQTMATGITQTTTFSYDTVNSTTTITDANGQATTLTYDANGQLTQMTLPPAVSGAAAQVYSYTYNSNGDVLTATDPRGLTTTYQYDANGNLTSSADTLGDTVTRTYDANNQLLTETVYRAPIVANQAPTAGNDSIVSLGIGDTLVFNPLANDGDPDGDTLTITAVSTPANGTASIVSGGTAILYTRTSAGSDTFTYTISDGQGHTVNGTVTVADSVNGSAQTPAASADTIIVAGNGTSLTFDPRANDSDADGDALTISAVSTPTHGTATIVNGGTAITYTRASAGADSFTYTISDGHGHTSTATVTVSEAVNVAPVAATDALNDWGSNGSMTFDPRVNDVDADGDTLTITAVTTPSHGTATIINGGTGITYSWSGQASNDSFSYTISDGHGHTITAQVVLTRSPLSVSTPASDSVIVTGTGTSLTFDPRANDSGSGLDITAIASAPTHGTATIVNGGAAIQYTRTSAGTDSLIYAVTDNYGNVAYAAVAITESGGGGSQNQAPNGVGDNIALNNVGEAMTFDPRRNDADFDADTLTITAVSTPAHGTATIVNGGTGITYTRTGNGGDTFTYTISDGNGHTATVTVTVGGTPGAGGSGGGGQGDGGPPVTTRLAYDSEGHLRFAVTPIGEVTEYVYNAAGQRVSAVVYRDSTYSLAGLGLNDPISESTLASWAAGLADKSGVMRTDTTYDFRGNVATVASYSAAATDGSGLTTQPYTVVTYVYDQFGNLLSCQTSGIANSEVFAYDGLGRMVSAIDLNGATTTVAFTDSQNQSVVTLANGLVKTSLYNLAGELISSAQSGTGITTATTTYKYDVLGQLRMVTDPTGIKSYYLYDNVGRKVADIAADGSLSEYGYDANNRLIKTISYINKLTTAQLNSLVDANGNPANVALSSIRPSANASDRWEWRIYDNANRLIEVIGSDGSATVFAYDSASELLSTTSYANVIAAGTVTSFKTTTPTTLQLPTANAGKDNIARNFYDEDGRLLGVLDGAGYLSQIVYNAAGQKAETIGFYKATNASLRASGTFAQLLADVGSDARDIHARYFYDGRGLLRYKLNASLRPCEYIYNAAGELIETIEYGASITPNSSYTFAYLQSQTAALASNTDNRYSWSVYDNAGRLAYSIDAEGYVTSFGYDAVGQVIKQLRFATSRTTSSSPDLATMNSWAATHSSSGSDRVARKIYDVAGRLVYGVDAEGFVAEYRYDTAGRVTLEVRYASVYSVNDSVTQASLAALIGGTIPGSAVQTSYVYDPVGRLSDSYDGEGVRTRFVYDTLGRVTDKTIAYGTSDAATTHYTYDAASRVASETLGYGQAEASTTSYTYDGQGNVLTKVDGRGYTTTYTYDALGHALTITVPLDASNNAVTTNTYDAFGNLSTSTDPRGNTSYFYYDALDRLVLAIDQENYATATAYNIGGAVITVTRYVTQVSGPVAGTPPTITTNGADATTIFTRDKLDRVTKVKDALNNQDQYTLDAFGNRASVTNKLSGVTTNVFDRRGWLTAETFVGMNAIRADGTTEATSVTNKYTYDARGNRTQMIEAFGLTEVRTTNYSYDKLDRLTQTTHDTVATVGTNLNSAGNATPTETVTYDNLGRVIQTIDAGGAKTFSYYDDLNRMIVSINAVGTYSKWTYDANGNVTSVRVYDTAVTLPGSPGGSPPSASGTYRETTYTYDRANRLSTTTVAGLRTGEYGASYATSTGNVVVTNTYDKNGNVNSQTDGRGNLVYFFYDKMGRKIAQVDQEKYLTSYTLDKDGNVTKEERFATAIATSVTVNSDPAALKSGVTGGGARTTNFTYDKNGRRLTETRTGVTAYTVSGAGNLQSAGTNATVSYAYNGLGEVTSKTEATGDTTNYTYDTFGRQTQTKGAAFTDYQGTANTRDTTDEYYDGLNNLVRTVQNTSRVTSYSYGAGGRLASLTDAAGFVRSYGYDAAGHTLKESYTRTKSNGTNVTEANAWRYDALGRVIFQSVASLSGSTWTFGDQSQVQYNTYGEVSASGLNSLWQRSFSYDSGGRVWKATADDGTTRLYIYDANGKQTLEISSNGAALPAGYSWSTLTIDQAVNLLTNNGASAIGAISVAGMVVTITVNDKRGLNTATREPRRDTGTQSNVSIVHSRAFNAFGEVTSETDARGNVTTFAYNTMGKIILQTNPTVSWTSATGATSNTQPTQNNYYDLSGRLVGVDDANGNRNTRTLLAGSGYNGQDEQVLKEFHADNGVFENKYDVFGDRRTTINEIGKSESYVYDAMSRLTQQVHQQRPANSPGNPSGSPVQLTDNYTYDGLGQRLTHWDSQLGSGVKETMDYDLQGRLTAMVDLGGDSTTYSYTWSNTIATTGLGTFGGWTKTTTNTANLSQTEKFDFFGRTVDKVDFGNHDDAYTFDLSGRLTQRTNSAGENVTFSYYNTGMLSGQTSAFTGSQIANTVTATYKYDLDANRTYEGISESGWYKYNNGASTKNYSGSYRAATVTWDAMNRMTGLTDTGAAAYTALTTGAAIPATINYKYDKAGNVRNMNATYRQMLDTGGVGASNLTQDYWYSYDAMNRFVITKGSLVGSTITAGATGTIAYDAAGNRASIVKPNQTVTWTDPETHNQFTYTIHETENYLYTADGYLAEADMVRNITGITDGFEPPEGTFAEAKYVRDAMGRVTSYTEYDTTSETPTVAVYSRTAVYNNKSQVTSDSTTVVRTDATWTSNTTYDYKADTNGDGDYVDAGDLYQGGVVTHQRVQVLKNGNDGATGAEDTDTKSTFVWWGSAQAATTTYDKDVGNGSNALWVSTYNYDATGNLQQVYIADGTPRTIGFVTDADGFVIARDEVYNSGGNSPHERHYYFNGVQLGDIGNNGTSDIDYAASIARHQAVPGTGKFMLGATSGTSNTDFDQSYDPINGLNYANTASHYTVQDGDTLASIAYQIWGDSSYWYLIADANGLSGDETLVGGQNLIIPNKVHNSHNSSDTYKVYDPNEAIGDTSPTHRKPPKHPSGGCGIVGQIIETIIAVVVAYYLGPVFGSGFLAAAATAAVSSTVAQGVGLALGIQSKFDWGSVAMAAISAGVTNGLGSSGIFNDLGIGGTGFFDKVAQGAITNAVTQGIEVATGLQSKFDWAQVAAAGVSNGVTSYLAPKLGFGSPGNTQTQNAFAYGVAGIAGSIAGAATATVINGKDFGDNLMSYLPNAIGQTIGNLIGTSIMQAQQEAAQQDDGWTTEDTTGATVHTIPVQVGELPPVGSTTTLVTGMTANPVKAMDVQVTSHGITKIIFAQPLSGAQFNAFLTGDLNPEAQVMTTEGGAITSNEGAERTLDSIHVDIKGTDFQADPKLDQFMESIAKALYNYQPGDYPTENFITIGISNGEYMVTSLQILGAQGSTSAEILPHTVAIAHTHGALNEYQQPDLSDRDWINGTNLPSFVIAGREGSNIWEIGRQNGTVKVRTITSEVSPGVPGPWEQYHYLPSNYITYNIYKYPERKK